MLTSLRLENYKSYASPLTVPLRRLNILIGKNNSGKTAFARLPLLLLGAAGNRTTPEVTLPSRVNGVTYSSNISELVHGQQAHGEFSLGYELTGKRPVDVGFTIQLRQNIHIGNSAFVSKWSSRAMGSDAHWPGPTWRDADGSITYSDPGIERFVGIFPIYRNSAQAARIEELRLASERARIDLLHMVSTRSRIDQIYENRQPESMTADTTGRELPYLLRQYPDVMRETADWYSEALGVSGFRLEVEASSFHLRIGEPGASHNFAGAGQGLQQVLPIAGYLNAIRLGFLDKRIFVIEEPELHLHPAGHGPVASLVTAALRDRPDLQVILETHSENLILRVRRSVATGELSAGDVQILWFEKVGRETKIQRIEINPDGSVSDWPSGVFAEDLQEAREILKAARR